jgi:hypothetical protein
MSFTDFFECEEIQAIVRQILEVVHFPLRQRASLPVT